MSLTSDLQDAIDALCSDVGALRAAAGALSSGVKFECDGTATVNTPYTLVDKMQVVIGNKGGAQTGWEISIGTYGWPKDR